MTEQIEWPIVRGDNEERAIKLTDRWGDPLPVRDIEVVITAKPQRSDKADDSDALFRHRATFAADGSTPDAVGLRLGGTDPVTGEDVSDPDAGLITEFLTPDDIATLAAIYDTGAGRGDRTIAVWDMQVRDAQGRRKTILGGTLAMSRDIGRVND